MQLKGLRSDKEKKRKNVKIMRDKINKDLMVKLDTGGKRKYKTNSF